jgi:hypothetical protein
MIAEMRLRARLSSDQWMQYGFQPFACCSVSKHQLPHIDAIKAAILGDIFHTKFRSDQRYGGAISSRQCMRDFIGIDNACAQVCKHLSGARLAGANAAGQSYAVGEWYSEQVQVMFVDGLTVEKCNDTGRGKVGAKRDGRFTSTSRNHHHADSNHGAHQ